MKRNGWLIPGFLAMALSCSGLTSGCGTSASTAGPAVGGGNANGSSGGLSVGIVTDVAGIGDQSFNMMAWSGVLRAQKELGVDPTKIESQQDSDYPANLERLADKGCKLVVGVGYSLRPALEEAAKKYPNTHFAIIDSAPPDLPNTTGFVFHEEEGAFLAGALAGGMTKSNKLGFVGGQEIPLIKKFEAGYRAGAKTVNPSVEVEAKYTNVWEDVAKGKELALALYGDGADIVFHASGKCGVGVISAAKSKGPGFWAIGVDADQDALGTADPDHPAPPSRVLTSMVKHVDTAVFDVCKQLKDGFVKGGLIELGLKDDGVGLSELKYTRQEIPAPLLKKVDQLKADIIAGKIHPPTKVEDLDGWKAPKI